MDAKDGVCVVAVFLKVGKKENPEIAKIIAGLKHCTFKGKRHTMDNKVDILKLIPTSSDYYFYYGSLARPPCIECTVWIVYQDPIEISHGQLDAFNELQNHRPHHEGVKICNNYRPLCPVGSRKILFVKVPKKGCAC
ncbi:unnamed protein product [Acanthoscelides obtectus]|uniref:carbonic anhydrase n=1 Tax=Acanthoscelides obtectus TaxID=200917 RepID=A0A9P0NRS4_ACAOB|nr:unnamed protein product [Acanthoscelides obtectus]CAK1665832.1 Carbonic anhydrase 1 [Acanthoscelides obtectus]